MAVVKRAKDRIMPNRIVVTPEGTDSSRPDISGRIVAKARSLGASLAGVAEVAALKESPSHLIAPKMEPGSGAGSGDDAEGTAPARVTWPEGVASAVVIALEHDEEHPELDWWYGEKSPPGNRILMRINAELSRWLEGVFGFTTYQLPYHVERGGIFLKDAAVLAGLGCIGKSNLLITPEFGPRVRLRALLVDAAIPATGPVPFDPCEGCNQPCRRACPQAAFGEAVPSPGRMGLASLPGRDGSFSRRACNTQMAADIDAAAEGIDPQSGQTERMIRYCRRCELACPVGS